MALIRWCKLNKVAVITSQGKGGPNTVVCSRRPQPFVHAPLAGSEQRHGSETDEVQQGELFVARQVTAVDHKRRNAHRERRGNRRPARLESHDDQSRGHEFGQHSQHQGDFGSKSHEVENFTLIQTPLV